MFQHDAFQHDAFQHGESSASTTAGFISLALFEIGGIGKPPGGGGPTRGMVFGTRGTAFNGGRALRGILT